VRLKAIIGYVNHARIHTSNQPILSNEGKDSCTSEQRAPMMWVLSTCLCVRL